MMHITVVGSTTWGTTLALLLARKGLDVWLLSRNAEEAARAAEVYQRRLGLTDMPFPPSLTVVSSPERCLSESQVVFVVVPAQSVRAMMRGVRPYMRSGVIVVSASKGLELGSSRRMSQIIFEELPFLDPQRIVALSGPNLAREIALGLPASSVVGGSEAVSAVVQSLLIGPRLRVYTNPDIIGVELGGALKNIIALGAGISDGLGYGDNAKAGLITRGLAEMTRLAVALGAQRVTLMGLAGLGDLVATCSSTLSRNHYVGEQLARGRSLADIRASMQNVAEGVDTTFAARELSQQLHVEMPITEQMSRVLLSELDPAQAVLELMHREPKPEFADN
ncbi:MAG: NAD(P)-dependent glycerol-3-phosphate dehydrogenase [Chloroflexota bacterium]|nr:MAG: NAD(P)-dependent glycerol-3-phosphate dehydrogenase [Chloroflexota bacterium]